jgi:hypothetical protein
MFTGSRCRHAGQRSGWSLIRAQRFEPDPPMSGGHIVMQHPEGNEFCLD